MLQLKKFIFNFNTNVKNLIKKNKLCLEDILIRVLQLLFNFFGKQRQIFSSENELHKLSQGD